MDMFSYRVFKYKGRIYCCTCTYRMYGICTYMKVIDIGEEIHN